MAPRNFLGYFLGCFQFCDGFGDHLVAQVVDPVLGIVGYIMSNSVGNMESELLVSLVPVMYDPDG